MRLCFVYFVEKSDTRCGKCWWPFPSVTYSDGTKYIPSSCFVLFDTRHCAFVYESCGQVASSFGWQFVLQCEPTSVSSWFVNHFLLLGSALNSWKAIRIVSSESFYGLQPSRGVLRFTFSMQVSSTTVGSFTCSKFELSWLIEGLTDWLTVAVYVFCSLRFL